MSPEQQAEKQYPIGYHPPGNFTVGANLRAAFLSGVQWQKENGWISVEDKPLFKKTEFGWVCTEDAECEFIAAVPYNDKTKPGQELWWIHHCVIEDMIGLCVVGEDENVPAGWLIEDILYYQPLPPAPASIINK